MKKETKSISYTFRIKSSVFKKLKELDNDGTGLNNVLERLINNGYDKMIYEIINMPMEDD